MEHDMNMGGMGGMGEMSHMMKMYFHFRLDETLLFKDWVPGNNVGYVFTCLAIFAFGALYESLRCVRWYVHFGSQKKADCCDPPGECCEEGDQRPDTSSNNSTTSPLTGRPPAIPCSLETLKDRRHQISTVLSFFQLFLAYTLMMVSMTYNVPYFLSLVLGHVVGYLILGPVMSVREEQKIGDCCS